MFGRDHKGIDMRDSKWVAVGAIFAGAAVAMGAFGAHSLKEQLSNPNQLANWETAVRYQMWHALALILFGLMSYQKSGGASAIGWLFTVGMLCFSGSLYALALGVPAAYIWPVTPAGGLMLLIGWVLFARTAVRPARE